MLSLHLNNEIIDHLKLYSWESQVRPLQPENFIFYSYLSSIYKQIISLDIK